MKGTRRSILAGGLAALAAPGLAWAQQGWRPGRPVRIITPFPPGGTLDVIARLLAEPLGALLGQAVVVENRTGAGGNIAAAAAIQAEPDGHSLFLGSAAIHGVNPVLYPNSGLNPLRDLAGIGTVAALPNILVVNPKRFDVHSVAEVVAAARARPGRVVYGSIGNGTSSHLAGEMFSRAAGIEVLYDDRSDRPGVKFNDADLIGNPIRLSVSKRTLAEGEAELRLRSEAESTMIPLADVVGKVEAIVSDLFAALSPDRE